MPIPNEELDFAHHLEFYKNLGLLTGDAKRDAHLHRKAEYLHSLCVCDAVRDLHFDAVGLSQTIANTEAIFQLRFGVARRAKFIWLSLRGLLALVNPERTEPLPIDQVEEVARDLNVIYINIRGALDNFAWFLLDMFGDETTRKLPPMRISLFGDDFNKDKNLQDVAEFTKGFVEWNRDLSSRRDPAAHRIPLSIPPAIIDAETREEYERLSAEYSKACNDALKTAGHGKDAILKFETAEALYDKLQRVGKFLPVFVHHPDEGSVKIYPTVPQDIGQLVKIARGISKITIAKMAA